MMTSILTYSRTVQGAAVRNVLENELGRDLGHVVTPGGKDGNDVLERVEGSPWVAEDGDRVERREGRERGEEGEKEGSHSYSRDETRKTEQLNSQGNQHNRDLKNGEEKGGTISKKVTAS